jgi:hypothetical protein
VLVEPAEPIAGVPAFVVAGLVEQLDGSLDILRNAFAVELEQRLLRAAGEISRGACLIEQGLGLCEVELGAASAPMQIADRGAAVHVASHARFLVEAQGMGKVDLRPATVFVARRELHATRHVSRVASFLEELGGAVAIFGAALTAVEEQAQRDAAVVLAGVASHAVRCACVLRLLPLLLLFRARARFGRRAVALGRLVLLLRTAQADEEDQGQADCTPWEHAFLYSSSAFFASWATPIPCS